MMRSVAATAATKNGTKLVKSKAQPRCPISGSRTNPEPSRGASAEASNTPSTALAANPAAMPISTQNSFRKPDAQTLSTTMVASAMPATAQWAGWTVPPLETPRA
jgi:hypothetical protein